VVDIVGLLNNVEYPRRGRSSKRIVEIESETMDSKQLEKRDLVSGLTLKKEVWSNRRETTLSWVQNFIGNDQINYCLPSNKSRGHLVTFQKLSLPNLYTILSDPLFILCLNLLFVL
jgi:hypothetical protein